MRAWIDGIYFSPIWATVFALWADTYAAQGNFPSWTATTANAYWWSWWCVTTSGAESRELVGKAIKMISDWKNDLIEPDKAMENLRRSKDMILPLCALYERNLRAYNAVDFDDLIVLPTKYCVKTESCVINGKTVFVICSSMSIRYQYRQYEMIKSGRTSKDVFTVVGDDDQSILCVARCKPRKHGLLKEDFPKS